MQERETRHEPSSHLKWSERPISVARKISDLTRWRKPNKKVVFPQIIQEKANFSVSQGETKIMASSPTLKNFQNIKIVTDMLQHNHFNWQQVANAFPSYTKIVSLSNIWRKKKKKKVSPQAANQCAARRRAQLLVNLRSIGPETKTKKKKQISRVEIAEKCAFSCAFSPPRPILTFRFISAMVAIFPETFHRGERRPPAAR